MFPPQEKPPERDPPKNLNLLTTSSNSPTTFAIPYKKGKKKEFSNWTVEEEYIFFEGHSLLGNKWTFISHLLSNKSAKQMKNHFYSSVVKTLRKIYNNKFDFNMKEIITTYYSLIYLKKLFSNSQFMYMLHNNINDNTFDSKNVTLKKYIINHHINYEKIAIFENKFEKSTKEQLISYFTFFSTLNQSKMSTIFNALIKLKLLYKSLNVLKHNSDNGISSKNESYLKNYINCFFKID